MALSEARKAEILEEEKLRLQARREAWTEAYGTLRGGGCYGGRHFWAGRALFWAVVIGGIVLLGTRHGFCSF